MQEREITSRIRIDQLQPLLDTTQERVTAPMPAVTLEALLQPEPLPPPEVQVTFRRTPHGTQVPAYVDFDDETKPTLVDAAVDAAIDAEIHHAEIEAAIDAVTHPASPPAHPRYLAFAVGCAAAFVTGVGLMLAL